ncbi:uncharacterized protein DUF3306 [Limnobacter thiooxidans]|uniref:DUF3306 domain-containing protein n=1 Tax=Limnobacter thiooxidans TaxID=131080 RepID=A0AA86MDJ7_9BURK|nr:DUF3306 domain-containing protein [Limnobacter sp.]MCZ8015474.1 DUF3306 domain-containing protein [Limnobacter sp.]RZS42559.1 uncharacterized protein DUF3306 [Limnobacter thiooxidans]BET26006.1 hypothetical protein RGQ30_15070 [Limnobacter thiooxidans]
MSDNFLSRWSRRKIEVRAQEKEGLPVAEVAEPSLAQLPAQQPADNFVNSPSALAAPVDSAAPELPLPTELDLAAVEQGGDIKAFLVDKVAPELKNKAFKALFSRPEFNLMDGLDIYIDDYNKFTPLSQEDIGKMSLSKQLLSRPDLEVIKPDISMDLPPGVGDETQDLLDVQMESHDPDEPSENLNSAHPDSENHEIIRVIPDAMQGIDSKNIDANRSFEKPGDISA